MEGVMKVLLLLSLFTVSSIACDQLGFSGIAEENDRWIPAWGPESNGMTEETFDNILDRVETIYTPILKNQGATLVVNRKWSDGTNNAYANQSGSNWNITMFGGLARNEEMTDDGFALVACHELGHHVGGAPKKTSWWFPSWASNEGQSDFYATTKCFRRYAALDDNVEYIADMEIPMDIRKSCEGQFSNAEEIAICARASVAGLSLARVLASLRKQDPQTIQHNTPDESVVNKTSHNHPAAQCRFDTYYAGALCDRSHKDAVDDEDPAVGFCNRDAGDELGVRSLCWFKP